MDGTPVLSDGRPARVKGQKKAEDDLCGVEDVNTILEMPL